MICLRCGYCCTHYVVAIVDDPELGFDPLGDGSNLTVQEGKGPCKHLRGSKPGEYSCAIHDKPWFKHTPCHEFIQVERSPSEECRLGKYFTGART